MKRNYESPSADVETFNLSGGYLTTSTGMEQGGEETIISDSEF